MSRFTKFCIGFLVALVLAVPQSARAQTGHDSPPANEVLPPLVVPFSQLGFTGQTLSGPYDMTNLQFNIPVEWVLVPGSKIKMKYTVKIPTDPASLMRGGNPVSYVYVHLNYSQIAFLPMRAGGEFELEIPISQWVTPPLPDGSNLLEFVLKNDIDCTEPNGLTVRIEPDSELVLTPLVQPTAPSLEKLPHPFYLSNSVLPVYPTTIVVPNAPDETEMRAALAVAAGLGSLSTGTGDISLVALKDLTETIKMNHHLIFVGKTLSLPVLSQLHLLSPLNPEGFRYGQIGPNDGVLQINNSPWNPTRAAMIVSGDTDEALLKASQSIRAKILTVPGFYGLAVIKKNPGEPAIPALTNSPIVNPSESAQPEPGFKKTFSELGYKDVEISGMGPHTVDYIFTYVEDKPASDEASLDLMITPAVDLKLADSLVVVKLNNTPINSFVLEQPGEKQTIHTPLPRTLVFNGRNVISVDMQIEEEDRCENFMDIFGSWRRNLWKMTIHADTLLRIPPATDSQNNDQARSNLGLALYADILGAHPTLDNLSFLLPQGDAASWEAAARAAFVIGGRSNLSRNERGPILLKALFSEDSGGRVELQNDNLVVVSLNTSLNPPAGAAAQELETDREISAYDSPVTFHLLPGASLGSAELGPSTWNVDRKMLQIKGNNSQGLKIAADVLVLEKYQGFLSGSAITTNGTQVVFSKP